VYSEREPKYVDILPGEITLGKVALVMLAMVVVPSGPKHRLILKLRKMLITESGVYEASSVLCSNQIS
jgi:hypothetical protein